MGPAAAAVPIAMAAVSAYQGYKGAKDAQQPHTTTQQQQNFNNPYAAAQPYVDFGLAQAGMNFMNPADPFPFLTPGYNPSEYLTGAMGNIYDLMGDSESGIIGGLDEMKFDPYSMSDTYGVGQDWIENMLTTDAAQNPYLEEMMANISREQEQSFLNTKAPMVASQYNMGGRTGSGMAELGMAEAQNQMQESIGNAQTNLSGQAFRDYLNTQTSAAGMVPGYEQVASGAHTDWMSAMLEGRALDLQGLGQSSQLAQSLLGPGMYIDESFRNSDLGQWQSGKDIWDQIEGQPQEQLQNYMNMIMPIAQGFGSSSGTGSNTQPGAQTNPWMSALQGGAGGYAMGSGMGGGKGGSSAANVAGPASPYGANPYGPTSSV